MKYVLEAKIMRFQKEVEAELLRKACPTRKFDIRSLVRSLSVSLRVFAYSQKRRVVRWIHAFRYARLFANIKLSLSLIETLEDLVTRVDATELGMAQAFMSINHFQNNITEIEHKIGHTVEPINIDAFPTLNDLKGKY